MPPVRAFKYASQMHPVPNCPPHGCKCVNMPATRYVHQNPTHPNNFLPPRVIKPQRRLPETDEELCSDYALSFFVDESSARSEYIRIMGTCQNFPKLVGTHIALVAIDSNHGQATAPDRSGH